MWLNGNRGKNIRKSISVIALKRDGTEARRWNILDVSPTGDRCGPEGGKNMEVACEAIVARMGRVELQPADPGAGNEPWDPGVYAILDAGRVDAPWSERGDGIIARYKPVADSSTESSQSHETAPGHNSGTDQFHTTTPGHESVAELMLRGTLTRGRQSMMQWINAALDGTPIRATVTVKKITRDGSDGKTLHYFDRFPSRYVFPSLSSSGTGDLYEEVSIKPIRMELAGAELIGFNLRDSG